MEISCKGWAQEAALRMLMNNLDEEVAERPRDLVVYGGTGQGGAQLGVFDAIVRVAAGAGERRDAAGAVAASRWGFFRTHEYAPRVLMCNSNLVGHWTNWEKFNELERAGLMVYGQMTAGCGFISARRELCRGRMRRLRQRASGILAATSRAS